MVRILIVAPVTDSLTLVSASAADDLYSYLSGRRYDVDFLSGLKANRLIFNLAVDGAHLVCYFGHGTPGRLNGLFSMLDSLNLNQVKGKIVYTMACLTAQRIGELASEQGTTWFGSTERMYALFSEKEHNYFEDWKNTILEIPKRLADGYTTGQAYSYYLSICNYYLNLYKRHFGIWKHAEENYNKLRKNMVNYRLIGDYNMRLTDTIKNERQPSFFERIKESSSSFFVPLVVPIAVSAGVKAAEAIKKEVEKRKKEKK